MTSKSDPSVPQNANTAGQKTKKSSSSESGNAKNVANFERMISFVKGYGPKYNPSQEIIKIPALEETHSAADKSLDKVHDAKQTATVPINERDEAFRPLKTLVTRIVNALDASGASDSIVKDAKTLARKIKGERAGEKEEQVGDEKNISASQMSYDNRLNNFKELVTLLSKEPLYKPNERELSVTALKAYSSDLSKKNTAVVNATTPLSNARIARNKILYADKTGLVDIAGEAKKYVKSVFNANSPEYKQISGLEFKKIE